MRRFPALAAYSLFMLSGAAGLIYESVWSRYLGLFVGHAAYAQMLVLAVFMGGLALGAALIGSRSTRLTDPLKAYAVVEIAVGLLGLVFHQVFVGATGWAYDVLFPLLGSTSARTVLKWIVAGALILPQTLLLGASFPLMAAGVLRRRPELPGRVLSLLYFTNGLGGAVGVLLAGFLLLAVVGLPGTVVAAATANLLVGLGAIGLARRFPLAATINQRTGPADGVPTVHASVPSVRTLLLAVAFGTAVASFIYEIGWLRMLAAVLGSATHSFEIMLSAFILGLALGAFWIRRRSDRWQRPLVALGIVQCTMGVAALATLPLYRQSFSWMATVLSAVPRTDAGYLWLSLAKYGVSLAIMLPSTFLAGMTLPLITKTLIDAGAGERAVGEVYAHNTLGAIIGAAAAGLVLLPVLGMQRMLVAGAALDMAIGIVVLGVVAREYRRGRALSVGLATVGVLAVVLMLTVGRVDPRLTTSGVFRYGTLDLVRESQVHFYRDGRTATVSVVSRRDPLLIIATNGKPDGSMPRNWLIPCGPDVVPRTMPIDAATQMLSPLITAAHAGKLQTAAVIGHGTGMSSHYLLGIPTLDRVTTIEIEPTMIIGSQLFSPANARVFEDPASEFALEDARTFFAARDETYDVILSEPSNPWVSGVASLFTVEFYRHVSRYLTADGVFGQWMHLYESNDDLVLTVLAALHDVFPSYALFRTSSSDLLIVASRSEQLEPDWTLFELSTFGEELCRIPAIHPSDLEVLGVADRGVFESLLNGRIAANSDFHPILDLGAERARFMSHWAAGFAGLGSDRFGIGAMLSGRRIAVPDEPTMPVTDVPMAVALAQSASVRAAGEALREGVGSDAGFGRASDAGRLAAVLETTWRNRLTRSRVPADWKEWLQEFRRIDHTRSSGAAGVDDPEFFDLVERYLSYHEVPAIVRYVFRHHRAAARWDLATLVDAADSILAHDDYAEWVSPTMLIESAVTAHVLLGDRPSATRIWLQWQGDYERPPTDVRRRLVESLVGDNEEAGR